MNPVVEEEVQQGIYRCCELIESVCKHLGWSQRCSAEAMYILNLYFVRLRKKTHSVQTFFDTPEQILAAACLMLRYRVHGREWDVMEPSKLDRLIDQCFRCMLQRRERATKAAVQKVLDIEELVQLVRRKRFPTSPYEELAKFVKESQFTVDQLEMCKRLSYHSHMYINDTYRSTICVEYDSRDIARACAYLVLQQMRQSGQQCLVTDIIYRYYNEKFRSSSRMIERIVKDLGQTYEAVQS